MCAAKEGKQEEEEKSLRRGYYGSGGGGGWEGRQTLTAAAYGHCEAFVVQFHSLSASYSFCCLLQVAAAAAFVVIAAVVVVVAAAALRELSNLSQVEF